jgi:hypothetical protein
MKRAFFFLLVIALASPAFAQFVPTSMENGMTMGLFKNEIDLEFQADPDFGQFEKSFLFAGLGNPISGLPFFNELDAFDTSFTAPLSVGYYMAGQIPISFYSSAYFTALAQRSIFGPTTINSTTPEIVPSGTTFTVHNWVSQSDLTTSTDPIRARTWQADLQSLMKLGPAIVGLYLSMDANNSAADVVGADAFFASTTSTFNQNTAAPNTVPVVALDYTITESIKNVNPAALPAAGASGLYQFQDTFRVGVPFAMRTGNLEHRAVLDMTFGSSDRPAAYSLSEIAHVYNAGAASNDDETLSITSRTTTANIAASYGLTIPAGAAGNEWQAGVSLGIEINGQEYAYDDLVRPYNLSALNTKTGLAGGSHSVLGQTFDAGIDFSGTLSGARVFAMEPATGMAFRFAPTFSLGIATVGNAASLAGTATLRTQTEYVEPLDANGVLDATVAYNTTTTTITGNPAQTFSFTIGAGLPMGITIMPAGWKFGFVLGAYPMAAVVSATTTSSRETTTITIVNTTGTTVNQTDINTAINGTSTSVTDMTYLFDETHFIGITIPFGGGVRFDARLNGSLLNFENFTIQGFIPLG